MNEGHLVPRERGDVQHVARLQSLELFKLYVLQATPQYARPGGILPGHQLDQSIWIGIYKRAVYLRTKKLLIGIKKNS